MIISKVLEQNEKDGYIVQTDITGDRKEIMSELYHILDKIADNDPTMILSVMQVYLKQLWPALVKRARMKGDK